MSHTERIMEDENDLHDLQSEIEKINQLKRDFTSQKEQIVALKDIIIKLQEQNQQLKAKLNTNEVQSTKGESCGFYSIREQRGNIPHSFRVLSPPMKTGLSKSSTHLIRNQFILDDRSFENHHRNQNQILDNFVDDLKFELEEKDRIILKEKHHSEKVKHQYRKYKHENERLKLLNEEYLQNQEILLSENEMLKNQLKKQTDLRYENELMLTEWEINKKKRICTGQIEEELMKMDRIYYDFQRIVHH